jgi:threonine dehydratase
VKQPGELTKRILAERLDAIVTVTDAEIADAIVLLLERVKLVVEGAGCGLGGRPLTGRSRETAPSARSSPGGNIDASLLVEVAVTA